MKDLGSIVLIIFAIACVFGQYDQDSEDYDEYLNNVFENREVDDARLDKEYHKG
ncbi:MAG: hypothetical protein ACTSRU_20940 [Candidatus Hodarchaeales archaeon]